MEWFNALPRRQQWFVVVGVIVVFFYLLYIALWAPLSGSIDKLGMQNQRATNDLHELRESAAKVKQLRGLGRSAVIQGSDMSLSQMVDTAVARHRIKMNRFQPSGQNEAQLWFDNVDFNRMLAYLDQMENGYGVVIKNIAVNAGNSEGLVTVRLRVAKN